MSAAPPEPSREPTYPAWHAERRFYLHTMTDLIPTMLRRVEAGAFRIPPFQRAWCWTDAQIAYLVDSLFKGYHVGQILVWERERLPPSTERIGEVVTSSPAGRGLLVIDGQQRLGALATAFLSGRFWIDAQVPALVTEPGPWRIPAGLCVGMRILDARYWGDAHAAEHGLDEEEVWWAWAAVHEVLNGVEIAQTVLPRTHAAPQVVESFKRLNTAGTPMDPTELADALARWERITREDGEKC